MRGVPAVVFLLALAAVIPLWRSQIERTVATRPPEGHKAEMFTSDATDATSESNTEVEFGAVTATDERFETVLGNDVLLTTEMHTNEARLTSGEQ